MQNYNELKVWEKAHAYTLNIYESSKKFPKEEIYSLTNKLRRAAASIPANIALGSANESEYFLILSKDLLYLNDESYSVLFTLVNEIKAMLIALINKVRSKPKT
jgi:23S rRNA-intervening sequence protein